MSLLAIASWIFALLGLGFLFVLRIPAARGWVGEWAVRRYLKRHFTAPEYRLLCDVTLRRDNGRTTQIDHVLISVYGIFVIETKHRRGAIYGQARQRQWTQCLGGGKYPFKNPLHQNYGHLKALEECFDIDFDTLHNVVIFVGPGRFGIKMPNNVVRSAGIGDYIRAQTQTIMSIEDVAALAARIETTRIRPGREARRAHTESLRQAGIPKQKLRLANDLRLLPRWRKARKPTKKQAPPSQRSRMQRSANTSEPPKAKLAERPPPLTAPTPAVGATPALRLKPSGAPDWLRNSYLWRALTLRLRLRYALLNFFVPVGICIALSLAGTTMRLFGSSTQDVPAVIDAAAWWMFFGVPLTGTLAGLQSLKAASKNDNGISRYLLWKLAGVCFLSALGGLLIFFVSLFIASVWTLL